MSNECVYLHGKIRDRIQDLMKSHLFQRFFEFFHIRNYFAFVISYVSATAGLILSLSNSRS